MKKIREIKLTNTLTGRKERLETLKPGKLTFYSCGPTVYGLIHIGNLRTALASDLFYRYFKKAGYDVTFVRNYTDVDDKIIHRAQEEGMSPADLAQKYIIEVEKDYSAASMLEPTHKTTVTTHIPEIISMIENIIKKDHAYVVEGEVIYSISSFSAYGKLSRKNTDELIAGVRVEVDEKKKNPLDFTLWKPAKPGEPSWGSPWGPGRPGWHIECSAMANRWLGVEIDIHHGGEDLIFPHHENEIAQSEAASGKSPFVRYWLHSAFLNFSKEKMSKSLGNVIRAHEFLEKFGKEVTRYLFLSVHYRSPLDFNEDSLDHALAALHRIYDAKQKALKLSKYRGKIPNMRDESLWGSFLAECERIRSVIDDQFANDFNTPGAFAALFSLVRDYNRILAEPGASTTPSVALASQVFLQILEEEIAAVIGVGGAAPDFMLKDLERIKTLRPSAQGIIRPTEPEIEKAIQARTQARKEKNFGEADRIRRELEARGVMLKDGPTGTTWNYI